MAFECKDREGTLYTMYLVRTPEIISVTDSRVFKILNIILRRAMGGLKMELVGRNLYDPKNKVSQ